ncbi:hypothetical protein X798_00714, partial [Onchocerca flexuosa]
MNNISHFVLFEVLAVIMSNHRNVIMKTRGVRLVYLYLQQPKEKLRKNYWKLFAISHLIFTNEKYLHIVIIAAPVQRAKPITTTITTTPPIKQNESPNDNTKGLFNATGQSRNTVK